MEDFETLVLKDYKRFLEDQELPNNSDSINTYISGLYWDLIDDLENNCKTFNIPKELDGIQAIHCIEQQIKAILLKFL